MAKLFATEAAQRVIDDAVQLFGGLGVMRGHPVERLYREIRALRIYEGATEVQKLIIAQGRLTDRCTWTRSRATSCRRARPGCDLTLPELSTRRG